MSPPKTMEVVPLEEKHIEVLAAGLPVTRQDLESIRERISILKEFVRSQMVVDVDYGVIPGTPKPSLFQPGAQKLARLFGLTAKKERTDVEMDKHGNFAMYTYRADIYHARSGQLIATCEGSCNSKEKKYAHRRINGALEETPIFDILNTLQKMAQKRAFVGGVIEAVGASDFFTQDIDSPEDAKNLGGREEPKRVKATVPKATAAHRKDASEVETCDCGKVMMISKYNEAEWYCNKNTGGCGAVRPRTV